MNRPAPPPPAARQVAAAAPSGQSAENESREQDAPRTPEAEAEEQVAARQSRLERTALPETKAAAPAAEPLTIGRDQPGRLEIPAVVTFEEAIRRLGGSIRLIDGLQPARVEAVGGTIRVLYAADAGEGGGNGGWIVLEQQRQDGGLVVRLTAPASVPPDSLARLRARIR